MHVNAFVIVFHAKIIFFATATAVGVAKRTKEMYSLTKNPARRLMLILRCWNRELKPAVWVSVAVYTFRGYLVVNVVPAPKPVVLASSIIARDKLVKNEVEAHAF